VFQEDFCCAPMLTILKIKVKHKIPDLCFDRQKSWDRVDDRGESLPACAKIRLQSIGDRTAKNWPVCSLLNTSR
jgi:hypothetical protein